MDFKALREDAPTVARETRSPYDAEANKEALEIARAWMMLSPDRQRHYRHAVFLEAAIENLYPTSRKPHKETLSLDAFQKNLQKAIARRPSEP